MIVDQVSLCEELWSAQEECGAGHLLTSDRRKADLELVSFFAPHAFNVNSDPDVSRDAALRLVGHLGLRKNPNPNEPHLIPRQWFYTFDRIFREGGCNTIAYGSFIRTIYTNCGTEPVEAKAFNRDILAGLRLADPRGIMKADELREWARLPAQLRVFRGSCVSSFKDAVNGISWTDKPSIAVAFSEHRAARCLTAGLPAVEPQVVHADVSFDAVLGVIVWSQGYREFLIDHEAVPVAEFRTRAPFPLTMPGKAKTLSARLAGVPAALIGLH